MPIPVTCPCRHEWTVGEEKAGDGVMCPSCGREVIVPVPVGLDVDKAREDARRAAAEEGPPSKVKSFARGLGTWIDQTFVQRRLFTVVLLLVLVVVVPILIWAASTVIHTLQHRTAVHYGRGVDDELGTQEMRERMRLNRRYREEVEAAKKAKEDARAKEAGTTSASKADAAVSPDKRLEQAKSLKEQGQLAEARAALQQLIEKHADSPQAAQARKILEDLPAASP